MAKHDKRPSDERSDDDAALAVEELSAEHRMAAAMEKIAETLTILAGRTATLQQTLTLLVQRLPSSPPQPQPPQLPQVRQVTPPGVQRRFR
jgi:hypothetical protein